MSTVMKTNNKARAIYAIAAIFPIVLLVITGVGQTPCKRHVEAAGGFSICPPEGWAVEEADEGQKYKKFFAAAANNFRANLNFRDETSAMTLPEYADASIKYVLANSPKIGTDSTSLVGKTDIATTDGLPGKKVIFFSIYKGLSIRSTIYMFSGKNELKILLTFTSLDADKASDEKLFDAIAKSFKFGE